MCAHCAECSPHFRPKGEANIGPMLQKEIHHLQ